MEKNFKQSKLFSLIFLLPIVFFAGCVENIPSTTGGITTTSGLIVTLEKPSKTTLISGDIIPELAFNIKNGYSVKLSNLNAWLESQIFTIEGNKLSKENTEQTLINTLLSKGEAKYSVQNVKVPEGEWEKVSIRLNVSYDIEISKDFTINVVDESSVEGIGLQNLGIKEKTKIEKSPISISFRYDRNDFVLKADNKKASFTISVENLVGGKCSNDKIIVKLYPKSSSNRLSCSYKDSKVMERSFSVDKENSIDFVKKLDISCEYDLSDVKGLEIADYNIKASCNYMESRKFEFNIVSTETRGAAKLCDTNDYSCSSPYDLGKFEAVSGVTQKYKKDMCGSEQFYKVSVPKNCKLTWKVIPYDSDYDLYVRWDTNCIYFQNLNYDCESKSSGSSQELCSKESFSGVSYAKVVNPSGKTGKGKYDIYAILECGPQIESSCNTILDCKAEDSDGEDIYVKGTCKSKKCNNGICEDSNIYTDYCVPNSDILVAEYIQDPDAKFSCKAVTKRCPDGYKCSDGKCIQQS
jgi:hypothetical protein